MATPYNQVSRDTGRALEEFSDEFRSWLAFQANTTIWAEQLGFLHTSDAIKTTFPLPLDAAGYKEFKNDIKFRSLYHRSLSLTTKEWEDGAEAKAIETEGPDFIGWAEQPTRMAQEWKRLPNELVATMLESESGSGPLLDLYRDPDSNTPSTRNLFATDHPYNVLQPGVGTFDNDLETTVAEIQSGKFFDDILLHFRGIKGPNGKPLGLTANGGNFLVPPERQALFKKVLEQDTLVRAVDSSGNLDATSSVVGVAQTTNIYKSTLGFVVGDELTNTDVFYAIAAGKPGLWPWVAQQETAPEEIRFDRDSDKYKVTRKVAIAYVGRANVAAAMPQCIAKVTITG